MSLNNYQKEIIKHAESQPEEEVCGLVLLNRDLTISIKKLKNLSDKKQESFAFSPQYFIDCKINQKILGIYHSHPKTTEEPSMQDTLISEEMGIPYLIYSLKTKKFFLYYPESYEPEKLIGRPYIKGFYECTCLFKDYFMLKLNINITKWNKNYWLTEVDHEANKQLEDILNNNLIKIKKEEIKKHDVIVFQLKENKRKHVGIYLGDDFFIHQCGNTVSRKQILDSRWQSKIKDLYRHPSFV